MRSPVIVLVAAVLALGLVLMSESYVHAQTLGPLDQYQFKGTHNSYNTGEPEYHDHRVGQQIMEFNVWALELDLCGRQNGYIGVAHYPIDGSPTPPPLSNYIWEILNWSAEWDDRVTFLWLDIKHHDYCNNYGGDVFKFNNIVLKMQDGGMDLDQLYRHRDFEDYFAEHGHWPSMKELLDADKHFIVVVDGGEPEDKLDHDYLFVSAPSIGHSLYRSHTTFINRHGPDLPPGEDPRIADRYMYRAYDLKSGDDWARAGDRGFNLMFTNYYEASWTNDWVHHAIPLYIGNYPSGGYPLPFGSWIRPWPSIAWGMQRLYADASPATPVYVEPGYYDERLTLDKPATLMKRPVMAPGHSDGNVVIGQPAP